MVENVKIRTEDLNIWFGAVYALKSVKIKVMHNEILTIIGPASSGKTTFLRALNRLNDLNPGFKMSGGIFIDDKNIYPVRNTTSRTPGGSCLRQLISNGVYNGTDVNLLRKKVGMIFALPVPLPMTIFDNIAYSPRMHGIRNKKKLEDIVEKSLQSAYLWDEVKDRLQISAFKLSGGQQQRLCIARTLAVEPEVILFDEPCSGLDPISTAKVEEAMVRLKERYTIILVTNNVKQAARVGERTAFFLSGELIELDNTDKIFTAPKDRRTNDYIGGEIRIIPYGEGARQEKEAPLAKIITRNLNFWYGNFCALKNINLAVEANRITAIIGPSGCGKSTLLRVFNRMNDLIEGARTEGEVLIDDTDVVAAGADLVLLRKKVGMVFQRPNPFPLSIYENIAFGPKVHNSCGGYKLDDIVEQSLKSVLLWDDFKDRLHIPALGLSLEQKQRLCIARLIAVKPEVLLMDEPCSALDPQATQHIEELMRELKNNYTIIIVTHNMQQAARVSDDTGFMLLGELVEFSGTDAIFTTPKDRRTEDYITGRYG